MIKQTLTEQMYEEIKALKTHTSKIVETLKQSEMPTLEMRNKINGISFQICLMNCKPCHNYQKKLVDLLQTTINKDFEPSSESEIFEDLLKELDTVLSSLNCETDGHVKSEADSTT